MPYFFELGGGGDGGGVVVVVVSVNELKFLAVGSTHSGSCLRSKLWNKTTSLSMAEGYIKLPMAVSYYIDFLYMKNCERIMGSLPLILFEKNTV